MFLVESEEPEGHTDIETDSVSVDECSGFSPTLGGGCTLSSDCSTITCKTDFGDYPITFKLKVC